jgi:hypothetical protein
MSWQIGLLFQLLLASLSLHLSLNLIHRHLEFYSNSKHQRKIIWILYVVPVYAISCLSSFVFVDQSVKITLTRDAYEAIVVYQFLNLFLEYLGTGYTERLDILQGKSLHMLAPPFCCLQFDPTTPRFIYYCKIGVMQFLFIRLFTAAAGLVLELLGLFCHGSMDLNFGNFYYTIANTMGMAFSRTSSCLPYSVCGAH